MKLNIFQKLCFALSIMVTIFFLSLFFITKNSKSFAIVNVSSAYVKKARYWERRDLGVICKLCPQNCYLTEGAKGICKVRMNKNNTLYTQVYNQPVSINLDPIEKKPVFHILPGTSILSISTVGCPLDCSFCQNWTLSQTYPEEVKNIKIVTPEDIVKIALRLRSKSIAYTYGEPVIFFEYMLETAKLAKRNGLRNVMVTSGYFNIEPLVELAPYFDVIKIDLKGISPAFYRKEVEGYLGNVLEVLKLLKSMKVLVEIVNLVVTNRNDSHEDIQRLCAWVFENMGADTPIFFSRFHPDYKLINLPPTPISTLERARIMAMETGLNFVYIGNVPGHEAENTYCPNDGALLVERQGFLLKKNNLIDGRCPVCNREIPGIWD